MSAASVWTMGEGTVRPSFADVCRWLVDDSLGYTRSGSHLDCSSLRASCGGYVGPVSLPGQAGSHGGAVRLNANLDRDLVE